MFNLPKVYIIGSELLRPYIAHHVSMVSDVEEADFVLAMNSTDQVHTRSMAQAKYMGKSVAWWTIEDPNWFRTFLHQAQLADCVFTSDEACIPLYKAALKHSRVFWLPLACSEEHHKPLPLLSDCSSYVVSANWYANQARRWSVAVIVDPLIKAGRSLALYCYASRAFRWPDRYHCFWKGEKHYTTVSQQYQAGCVVLGPINQRSGFDGVTKTYMTSMRTFEALACAKPFLAAASDAYERLGFVNWEHMVWTADRDESVSFGDRLLGDEGRAIGSRGRQFVLSQHTYRHRIEKIAEVMTV